MSTTDNVDALKNGPARRDYAAWLILLVNGVTLVVAIRQDWRMIDLVFPFWIQSVVIGLYSYLRMMKLRTFSTADLLVNGQPVDATPKTRRSIANFFALHYGLFHLAYLLFLGALTGGDADAAATAVPDSPMTDPRLIYTGLILSFLISHGVSHYEHVAADLAGKPNIGTLMFMPYLRVIPMHLAIVCGAIAGGSASIVFFMALKTSADLSMHWFEHRRLAGKLDKAGSGKRVREVHNRLYGSTDSSSGSGRKSRKRQRR